MGSNPMDVEIEPGVFVPPPVVNFLLQRLQWIKGGEEGPFQVLEPKGFEFHDLCTLAYLIANNHLPMAAKMAVNLPRPPMMMMRSSSLVEANDNYLAGNPFKRRRAKKRRNKHAGSGEMGGLDEDDFQSEDSNKDSGSLREHLMQPVVVVSGADVDSAVEKKLQLLDLQTESSEDMEEEENLNEGGGDEDADMPEQDEENGDMEEEDRDEGVGDKDADMPEQDEENGDMEDTSVIQVIFLFHIAT